jgi:hypothetical protein
LIEGFWASGLSLGSATVNSSALQSVRLDGQGEDPEVDLALLEPLQQVLGLVLVEHETQLRQRLAQLLHDARQQIRADGGYESHFQLAGKRVGVVACERDDLVALAQHVPRARDDLLAHLRELDVFRMTLHQLHAEILLELLQLRGQRRLAHERAFCRAPEMTGIGQRHQVLEVLEIHSSAPTLLYRRSLSNPSV